MSPSIMGFCTCFKRQIWIPSAEKNWYLTRKLWSFQGFEWEVSTINAGVWIFCFQLVVLLWRRLNGPALLEEESTPPRIDLEIIQLPTTSKSLSLLPACCENVISHLPALLTMPAASCHASAPPWTLMGSHPSGTSNQNKLSNSYVVSANGILDSNRKVTNTAIFIAYLTLSHWWAYLPWPANQ